MGNLLPADALDARRSGGDSSAGDPPGSVTTRAGGRRPEISHTYPKSRPYRALRINTLRGTRRAQTFAISAAGNGATVSAPSWQEGRPQCKRCPQQKPIIAFPLPGTKAMSANLVGTAPA